MADADADKKPKFGSPEWHTAFAERHGITPEAIAKLNAEKEAEKQAEEARRKELYKNATPPPPGFWDAVRGNSKGSVKEEEERDER
ncbi:MAG: hypothetical protein ACYCS8_12765 [Acidithiobacillus sp.]